MLSSWKSFCSPISQRWLFALMGFFSQMCMYSNRICLSLAITQMVIVDPESESTESLDETCPSSNSTSTTNSESGTFDWDDSLQGLILSAFYWGYVISHIPGGLLAERYGGKLILSIGLSLSALVTLFTPLAVEIGGSTFLIILRIIMGLGEGMNNPAVNVMLARWSPPSERSKLGTLVFAGNQIGSTFVNLVSGLLLQYSPIGWSSVFYFFGSISVIWVIVFLIVCYNSPNEHPFISDKERQYINDATQEHTRKKLPITPWRYILTSIPIWALVVAQIGHDWGLFTIMTDLPLYMNNVLKFSISSNGFLTAIPYLGMWIFSMICSWIADWLINTNKMSATNVRKLLTTIGSMGPAIFIVLASYAGCERVVVVIYFIIGMTLMGAYYPGMKVNILDLSPNYSGTVMGIVSGIGALSGIITPYLVGILTPDQTLVEWRIVFWIVFVVFLVTNLVYLFYASGDVQFWNDPELVVRDKEEKKRRAAGESTEKVAAEKPSNK